jgi:hypothetical protein
VNHAVAAAMSFFQAYVYISADEGIPCCFLFGIATRAAIAGGFLFRHPGRKSAIVTPLPAQGFLKMTCSTLYLVIFFR